MILAMIKKTTDAGTNDGKPLKDLEDINGTLKTIHEEYTKTRAQLQNLIPIVEQVRERFKEISEVEAHPEFRNADAKDPRCAKRSRCSRRMSSATSSGARTS